MLLGIPGASLAMEKGKSKTPEREVIEVSLNYIKPGSPQQAASPKNKEHKRRFSLMNIFVKSSNEGSSSGISKTSTNSAPGDYTSAPNTPRAGTPKSPKTVHFDEKRNSVKNIENISGERELCMSPRTHKQKSTAPFLPNSLSVSSGEQEETISFSYYVGSESDVWHNAAQQLIAESKQKEASPTINQLAIAVQAATISSKHNDEDYDDE